MQNLVDTANTAYKNGNYPKAIQYYDSVVEQGYVSAELYYNLGNAYFKDRQLAHAILYYEKALNHDPGNEDIQHNLDMARQMTVDKIEKVPEMFYVKWWRSIYNLFSADWWAYLSVGFFILTLVLTGLFILSRRIVIRKFSFYTGVVTLLITVFSFVLAAQKHHDRTHDKAGIVFEPSVTVKGSPDEDSVDLFVIHEGTKVFITDKLGQWYEIKIANGSVGWLEKDSIKEI
ncbi:MAG: tetratricopeptide repeat protein [Bacteroidales bacterium]|nr:tetratricopeptide repeat protein [Bacteroidales bacterium]MCF8332976.1 tetratricopeptide repeat protein [Bacteroidales bacterium]